MLDVRLAGVDLNVVEHRLERDRLGDPEQRQVSGDLAGLLAGALHLGRLERHGRKFLGVEEVGRAQKLIAAVETAVDAVHPDRDLERRFFRIVLVEREFAVHVVEASHHLRHGVQPVDREPDKRVRLVQLVQVGRIRPRRQDRKRHRKTKENRQTSICH
jgi:hypothetical protein